MFHFARFKEVLLHITHYKVTVHTTKCEIGISWVDWATSVEKKNGLDLVAIMKLFARNRDIKEIEALAVAKYLY